MTISPVREFHAAAASSGTAASCAISVSPAANNHLVCSISSSTNDTIPTPAGWTAIGTQTVDTTNVATFWKKAAGTETTVSVTLAVAGAWNIHYAEWNSTIAGNWTAGVVANNVPQAAATALLAGTTAATAKANALAWAVVTGAGTNQAASWSNSFTANTTTASATTVFFLESAYKILSATGTQTTTDTVGVSVASGWTGQIVTFYEPTLSSFSTIVRARRRPNFARRGTGRTVGVALTQQPTPPPAYVSNPVRQRSRTSWTSRRRQPVVPLTQTASVTVTFVPQISRSVRRGLWTRDRQQPVTPIVIAVSVPQIQRPMRMVRRGLWARSRQQPILPNQSVAAVQATFLPDISSARRRPGFTRRGHLVTVTITQSAALAPTYVPSPSRLARRTFPSRTRQRVVTPIVVSINVPQITRPMRMVRRGLWARDRQQPVVPIVATIPVTVVYVPSIASSKARRGFRRRGTAINLVLTNNDPVLIFASDSGVGGDERLAFTIKGNRMTLIQASSNDDTAVWVAHQNS